jgi:hypothetical protein
LRRTYADFRADCGDPAERIARQGDWEDPRFVFQVYQGRRKRREKLSGRYLVAFDAAVEWGRIGRNRQEDDETTINPVEAIQSVSQEMAA